MGVVVAVLLLSGCAAQQVAPAMPAPSAPAASRPLPSATWLLGQARTYAAADGSRIEVVHDPITGGVLVKLPDNSLTLLPEEIAGTPGRYRDSRLVLWESDAGVVLWRDGQQLFSGRPVE